jgi:hypothetical protein
MGSLRRQKGLGFFTCTQFVVFCITASEKCPRGYCAEFTLLTLNATVVPLSVNGSQLYRFEETCTPVRGIVG